MMLCLDLALLVAAFYVDLAARAVDGLEDARDFHIGRREDHD